MNSQGFRPALAGFSVLELLVAMAIMALTLTLLYRVNAGGLASLGRLSQSRDVDRIASQLLETRDCVPTAGWTESGQLGPWFWSVQSTKLSGALPTESSPRLYRVWVEVRRADGTSAARPLTLATRLPACADLP